MSNKPGYRRGFDPYQKDREAAAIRAAIEFRRAFEAGRSSAFISMDAKRAQTVHQTQSRRQKRVIVTLPTVQF